MRTRVSGYWPIVSAPQLLYYSSQFTSCLIIILQKKEEELSEKPSHRGEEQHAVWLISKSK